MWEKISQAQNIPSSHKLDFRGDFLVDELGGSIIFGLPELCMHDLETPHQSDRPLVIYLMAYDFELFNIKIFH
jgi:hypothetical protein